jgi:hypothetical protein
MPNTPQVNPLVQIQGELIKAGIMPKAGTSMKAMVDLIKEGMVSESKMAEIKSKAEASQNRVLLGLVQSMQAAKTHIEQEKIRQAGATEREKLRGQTQRDVAKTRGESVRSRMGDEKGKYLDKLLRNVDADIKNLDVQIAAAKNDAKQKLIDEQAEKKAQKSALEDALQMRDAGVPLGPVDQLRNPKPVDTKDMDKVDAGGPDEDDDNMNFVFRTP